MATLVQRAENELKFGEDAQHIHVALNIFSHGGMNLCNKIEQVLQGCQFLSKVSHGKGP
jgi:hypothetical protein